MASEPSTEPSTSTRRQSAAHGAPARHDGTRGTPAALIIRSTANSAPSVKQSDSRPSLHDWSCRLPPLCARRCVGGKGRAEARRGRTARVMHQLQMTILLYVVTTIKTFHYISSRRTHPTTHTNTHCKTSYDCTIETFDAPQHISKTLSPCTTQLCRVDILFVPLCGRCCRLV